MSRVNTSTQSTTVEVVNKSLAYQQTYIFNLYFYNKLTNYFMLTDVCKISVYCGGALVAIGNRPEACAYMATLMVV